MCDFKGSTAGLHLLSYVDSGHPSPEHYRVLLLGGTRQLGLLGAELIEASAGFLHLLRLPLHFHLLLLPVDRSLAGIFR